MQSETNREDKKIPILKEQMSHYEKENRILH